MKTNISLKTFWQTIFTFTFIVNLVILIWSISRWIELKVILWRSIWVVPLVFYLAVLVGCIALFRQFEHGLGERLVNALEMENLTSLAAGRLVGWGLFSAILVCIPYLKFTFRIGEVVKKSTQDPVLTTIVFYWGVWWLLLLAAGALKLALKSSWPGAFATTLVIFGIAYEVFIRAQLVSTYPFSLGWSETSRFYYGSLYFAQSVYGTAVPLSTLHPTRYFLQSLPFLIPGLGLVASRVWQVLLWMGLTSGAALVLASRTLTLRRPLGWLLAGWLFLFLLRVGVYYHLEVMVIIPIVFVSAKHPWRSLLAVTFASAWAGVSRVNWFPVPAMLAIAIYLLEEQVSAYKNLGEYLKQPIIWGFVGLFSALAAQAIYIPLSGNANNVSAFGSSFTSDLLLDRLWPNDTFPLGVLPAILIVSGPLLVILVQSLRGRLGQLHPLRWLGLLVMLGVLFVGGLVVSVKIGGGGDLHNMDAYAVLVGLVAAYFIGDKVKWESGPDSPVAISWPVVAVGLIIPLIFLIPALSSFPRFNDQADQAVFAQLKTLVEVAGQKGPVLFIHERHLVTFHDVNVTLVPDYENVTLMEMAMSNNQAYLQRFYADLRNHRFAAIVAGKQNVGFKDEGAFSDENNVWNTRISPYIVCYYQSFAEFETNGSKVDFYVPRAAPEGCP